MFDSKVFFTERLVLSWYTDMGKCNSFMKRRWKYFVRIIMLLIILASNSRTVLASDYEKQPPHLIQSVSEKDIFEGLLELGFLQCDTPANENSDEAYEIVKDCVVRIDMGKAYGSGVVWEITPDRIVIVTNQHVLAYWNESVGIISFPQGFCTGARILGSSSEYDIGFLEVEQRALAYEQLTKLRYVRREPESYEKLYKKAELFTIGSGKQMGELEYHKGIVIDKKCYIEIFDSDMLYASGFAKSGMSGGGTFDAKGNLVGLLAGGTENDKTASVPLPLIYEAYMEVMKNSAHGSS